MDTLRIFDTTLRDGEQAPGAALDRAGKIEIARHLERLGVDIIEAGFPISSPEDFESVKQVSETVKGPVVCGLSRCLKQDIEACRDALMPAARKRIHLFIATSPIHMEYKLRKKPHEVMEYAIEAIKYATKFFDDVQFSPEDASRSEPEFLYKIIEAVIEAGATTINIPDTVGYAVPEQYASLISGILNNVSNINKAVISVHCHDDLGMAVANSLAAVKAGARQVECTINGMGERAGNAAMEEIVMALRTRKDYFNIDTNINTMEIMRASRLVSKLTGFVVAPNKSIVGRNAFRHESGIHQDGVLKHKMTYEIMSPQDVGIEEEDLVLGKHSGRHALSVRLKKLGLDMEGADLDKIFEAFKALADKKKEIFDDDLIAIVENEMRLDVDKWQFVSMETCVATDSEPKASVVLLYKGKQFSASSSGDGPVDACFKAVDKITRVPGKLLSYTIQAITSGKDAQGEVSLSVEFEEGIVINSHAASTDIIEASLRAYLNAVNKVYKG